MAAPAILTANKSGSRRIVGNDEHAYEIVHGWGELPDKFSWQTTHNVAVDKEGRLYVIHEGRAQKKDHPAIFVFDSNGKYVRSFGSEFQGGGHGIEVREENGTEYLYVCAYQGLKTFAKLDLKGERVWKKMAPMDSGVYAEAEDTKPTRAWGRDRFMPTNFAFLPDGDFLLADGYGSFYIHRYDQDGNWKSHFGGPGEGKGKFNTPHGIWIDNRDPNQSKVLIADRAHHTIQVLDLDGKYIETISGFGLPANMDIRGDLLLVPELLARITLLDKDNRVVATLGDDVERIKADKKYAIRRDAATWRQDKFVHPHDACFDADGNIFVAEWVASGRVSKLKKL